MVDTDVFILLTDILRFVIDDVFANTDKLRDVINVEFVNNEFKFVT
jgi:hypothetical protein